MAHYVPIDPSKSGGVSLSILVMAFLGSVGVFGASIFLAVTITQAAINSENPVEAPPAPLPEAPVTIPVNSTIQMAMLFLHAQKSGALPPDYPITWRGDSGLSDGLDQNRNMVGGFYTGGSNVKHNFPIAFSMTMLSWALLEYESVFKASGLDRELTELIQWGVTYLLQTKFQNIIFPQVGDPAQDYDRSGRIQCWMRPEDMKPEERPTLYPCDCTHPCSDLAGEYAAAFAAASLVYRIGNPPYADFLLQHAKEALRFADQFRGRYTNFLAGSPGPFTSSGYEDEILWGAAWLYYASNDTYYLENYVLGLRVNAWSVWGWKNDKFNWDNKWPGVQVLMTRLVLLGDGLHLAGFQRPFQARRWLNWYRIGAQKFACRYIHNVTRTRGNLMWDNDEDHSLQNPINAGFLTVLLAEYERAAASRTRGDGFLSTCGTSAAVAQATFEQQRDYILGGNPLGMSYMVGYLGADMNRKTPGYVHHRAASIPPKQSEDDVLDCSSGLRFLRSSDPNPNLLYGAVVGGPAIDDTYDDDRNNTAQSEPYLHVNAVFVGLLAALNASHSGGNNITRMWAAMQPGPVYAYGKLINEYRTNLTNARSQVPRLPPPSPSASLPPPPTARPAKVPASPAPIKKQPAKRPTAPVPVKKQPAKRPTAPVPVKKQVVKRHTAPVPVKKQAVKRATVKRATVKRATVKRSTVKRATVKRATVKRATAKRRPTRHAMEVGRARLPSGSLYWAAWLQKQRERLPPRTQ